MIGIPHLENFWARKASNNGQWVADNTLLSGLRLGLHETLRYLQTNPTLDEFERWVVEKNGGAIEPERIARINAAIDGDAGDAASLEPALTPEEMSFWDKNGYVILHDAVPPENCRAAAQAIYEFLEAAPGDPDSWYRRKDGHTIWVPLLHHPVFLDNRNSPRIHSAFAQLWGRADLWMNTDQSGFNPPERADWHFPGPYLHWDVSLAQPIPFGTQGILYLTDTAANQGAFQCVPGFHRKIEAWLHELPPDADPRSYDFSADAIPIAGRAGDLVIWHHALPHGSSPNRATMPRVVQYMNMRPSNWEYNPEWK